MSGEDNTPVEPIGDQAAEWILRRENPGWSDEEQVALDAWLALSPHHLAAYWRLKAGWSRAERLAALKPGGMRPTRTATTKDAWPIIRFAAVACVVLSVAVGGLYSWSIQERVFTTAVGQRASISLSDGSRVELNTNSSIGVRMGFWQRSVSLKHGEAFFDVHHDASRPFSVFAVGHRIVDLGTQFTVQTSGDRLKVTLVQGLARLETVSSAIQHHATDLMPGDVAVATPNSMSVAKVPENTIAEGLAWRQGKLVFNNATLAEAAAEFNRYNSNKLTIEPSIASLRINGIFDAGSIGPFTTMAKFAFGLSIEKRGNEIVMSRKKV